MANRFKTWRYWRDEWINPFIIAFILAMIIRTFIFQPFKIPSTSMYPTLKVGDRIFVNKFLYGAKIPFINKRIPKVREPERGDIIVFVSVTDPKYPEPEDEHVRLMGPLFFNKKKIGLRWYHPRYLVKRLVGLPGDRVEIKDSEIYINGKILEEPLIMKSFRYFNSGEYGKEGIFVVVPPDSFFVLGDNSANSIDSRFWGFVPRSQLTGKMFIIWWPFNRVRLMK